MLFWLNWVYKLYKEDIFVFDFFNFVDDIKEFFELFYIIIILSQEIDVNKLNDFQDVFDEVEIYIEGMVYNFIDFYFKGVERDELDLFIDICKQVYDIEFDEDQ